MRKILISLFLILFITKANGQVIVLQEGDSTYQERVSIESIGVTNLWKFKPNLLKGEYWVIEQTECGSDTLKYAKFIDTGIKHGTWIEWESNLCFGKSLENTDEVDSWSFASDKEKYSEVVYDSGHIIKSTLYHLGSKQSQFEYIYPEFATKEIQWIEERVWSEEGNLKYTKEKLEDGSSIIKTYYTNGNLETIKRLGDNGAYEGIWEFYYENGNLIGKGEIDTELKKPKGKWQYWDDKGKLIAGVTFINGEPININRYQRKKIPYSIINNMIENE